MFLLPNVGSRQPNGRDAQMTSALALLRIFYRPWEAFRFIKDERSWFLAALLVFLFSCAIWFVPGAWVTSVAPSPQIFESNQQVDTLDQNAIGLELDKDRGNTARSQPETDFVIDHSTKITQFDRDWASYLIYRFAPLTFILLFGFLLLEACYYRLIGLLLSLEFRISDWFRFSIWSRLPAALLSVIFTVLAESSGAFKPTLDPDNVLALASWVNMPDSYIQNPIYYLRRIDVGLFWVIVLQTIGIREWCSTNTITSLMIVVIPVVLYYTIVAFW